MAIASRQSVFRYYKTGILNSSSCGSTLDHAVLLVGYGSENGQDYWIIKNSWGTRWGDQGYVKIARTAGGAGICGIYAMNSYPVLQ